VRLGLDRPFFVRWGDWMIGAFQGEFGDSCILRARHHQPAGRQVPDIAGDLPRFAGAGLSDRVPVGIIAAATRNPVLNNSLRFLSYLGLAMPNFLLALMIMLFSTVWFGDTLTGCSPTSSATRPGAGTRWRRLPVARLAADLHPRLVGDGLRASRPCAR
jgi:peptide/nickel transport system permease protein